MVNHPRVRLVLWGVASMVLLLWPITPVWADDCETLGITGETREAIQAYVSDVTTTVDIGLLIAGGLAVPLADSDSHSEGLFHMALSGGVTYAVGLDLETYCEDFEAPLPPGLGWQVFVASNDFADIEVGALGRYHGELNLASPDILLELGGFYRWADEDRSAPGVLASVGFGTQVIQILVQGQFMFDDDSTAIVIAGVRVDAYLFRLLF